MLMLKFNNGGIMFVIGLGIISFNEFDEKIKFVILIVIRVII